MRLIEDFLSRTQQGRCYELKETAEVLAKVSREVVALGIDTSILLVSFPARIQELPGNCAHCVQLECKGG